MAIYGVFGLPRAGKSTFLTACADRALSGKSLSIGHFCWKTPIGEFSPYERVYTNFDCKGCYKLDFDKLGIEDFSNCLILIDEIMLLCDSRDYKNFPVRLRNFLALHGHSRVDILYCSQGYADTDKRFRNLTDKIFYIQKRGSFTLVSPIEKSWRIDQDIQEGIQCVHRSVQVGFIVPATIPSLTASSVPTIFRIVLNRGLYLLVIGNVIVPVGCSVRAGRYVKMTVTSNIRFFVCWIVSRSDNRYARSAGVGNMPPCAVTSPHLQLCKGAVFNADYPLYTNSG